LSLRYFIYLWWGSWQADGRLVGRVRCVKDSSGASWLLAPS